MLKTNYALDSKEMTFTRGLWQICKKTTLFSTSYIQNSNWDLQKKIIARKNKLWILDILFSSNHNVDKIHVTFVFGLQTFKLIDLIKIFQLKGLKPKNKGHVNFYECCDLTKKVYLMYVVYYFSFLIFLVKILILKKISIVCS